jgi:hypothetical protein
MFVSERGTLRIYGQSLVCRTMRPVVLNSLAMGITPRPARCLNSSSIDLQAGHHHAVRRWR